MNFTHTAIKKGVDARTPKTWSCLIHIRETKLYWVDRSGSKYAKNRYGFQLGDWPPYMIELESIAPLNLPSPTPSNHPRGQPNK